MAENTRRILDQQEATSLSGDDFLVADNANLGTRKISYERLLSGATPLPPNYLTGFVITKTGNTTFSVSSGYARSMDNVRNIVLNNVINKNLSSFVMGDGGSMPDSLSAQQNKVYYVFALVNAGGLVDIILDTNINCTNGLADATVQANNFNKWARIGEIKTRSNAIEIVNPMTYSMDFHDLKIRSLNLIAQDSDKTGGKIEFLSAPNEVNAGKRMYIIRYDSQIRIIGISSNDTTKLLLNANVETGEVEGNIGKAGIIYPFGGSTVPEGFLPCNGAEISRTRYNRLFAAIGTTWGAGDGSTTFNVPNFNSVYLPTSYNQTVAIKGNNIALGLTNGSVSGAMVKQSGAELSWCDNTLGAAVSPTAVGQRTGQNGTIGITTDSTKSGLTGTTTISRMTTQKWIIKY